MKHGKPKNCNAFHAASLTFEIYWSISIVLTLYNISYFACNDSFQYVLLFKSKKNELGCDPLNRQDSSNLCMIGIRISNVALVILDVHEIWHTCAHTEANMYPWLLFMQQLPIWYTMYCAYNVYTYRHIYRHKASRASSGYTISHTVHLHVNPSSPPRSLSRLTSLQRFQHQRGGGDGLCPTPTAWKDGQSDCRNGCGQHQWPRGEAQQPAWQMWLRA